MRLLLLISVLAVSLLPACSPVNGRLLTVTGQLEGVYADVGSKVGGRVSEVLAQEGDRVTAGAELVRLEPEEARAQLAAAQALLMQSEALVRKLEQGARPEELSRAEAAAKQAEDQLRMARRGLRSQEVEAADAQAEAFRAQRDQAESDWNRIRNLFEQSVVSQRQYDQAKHAFEAAEAQFQTARQQADLAHAGTREEQVAMAQAAYDAAKAMLDEVRAGPRQEDIEAAHAARDAAAAQVTLAEEYLREMTVLAPFDGYVESLDLHPGDLVKPGALGRVTKPDELELWVYVSAKALGYISLGQKVSFTTDTFADERFDAEVVYVASQGEFTPRNLQTREERVQQMFGVKLRAHPSNGRLKAGMTATVHFTIGNG